jgi:hypothetical protein
MRSPVRRTTYSFSLVRCGWGRWLTEEERVAGFCALLSNEDWTEIWSSDSFEVAASNGWEYTVVRPLGDS